MTPDRYRESLLVSAAGAFRHTQWQPSVDAYRTKRGWLLKYELAGVMPQDVEVAVSGQSVRVRGARRDIRLEEALQSYSMEISYNQFERTVQLPCDLSQLDVVTDYRDGMLLVWLNCKETVG